MFQSGCFVGFHTKAQKISLFHYFSFLTQRSPWYSWSVCCGWLISFSLFSACFYSTFSLTLTLYVFLSVFFFPVLVGSHCAVLAASSQPFIHFSAFYGSLLLSFSLCVHLQGWVHIVANIRGEIRRSGLIEATVNPPQRQLYSNRGYRAYQAKVLSFRPNTLHLLEERHHGSCNPLQPGTFVKCPM